MKTQMKKNKKKVISPSPKKEEKEILEDRYKDQVSIHGINADPDYPYGIEDELKLEDTNDDEFDDSFDP